MTKKYTKELIIPKDKAKFYKKHANLTGEQSVQEGALRDTDRDFCYIEEVTFDNGYRVVIELIIGEDDNPNWAEGSLFNPDEYEVQTSVAEDGNIFGEWFFWTREPDVEYTVIVKEETIISYRDGSDGRDEAIFLYEGETLINWKKVNLNSPTDEDVIREAKKYFNNIPNNINVFRPLEVNLVKEGE